MPPARTQRRSRVATRSQRRQRNTNLPVASESATLEPAASTSAVAVLPSSMIEQLVTTITAKVTDNLAPLLVNQQQNQASSGPSDTLVESAVASANNVVGAAVSRVGESLSGELRVDNETTSRPQQLFQSVGVALDARVPAKLKSKIWSQDYIDLGSLLVNPIQEQKYQLNVVNGSGNQPPSLCLESTSKPKRIQTIETWVSAFRIFVSVYTQKFPIEAPALMKYADTIQDLAGRGNNWRYYDENFRFLRQSDSSSLPWGNLHWELWLKSQVIESKKSFQPNPNVTQRAGKVGPIPKGFCYRFHSGKACSGCDFKHSCFKCEGSHKGSQCLFRAQHSSKASSSAKQQSSNSSKN